MSIKMILVGIAFVFSCFLANLRKFKRYGKAKSDG